MHLMRWTGPALLLSLGAALLAAPAAAQRATGEILNSRIDTTLALGAGGAVELAVMSGNIRVTTGARDRVRIRGGNDRGRVRLEATSGRIVLETINQGWQGGDTRFEVEVPEGTSILLRTTSADMSVRGVRGDVEARTTSGNIEIQQAGRVQVQSVSGDVRVENVSGDFRGSSVSGDVSLTGITGEVDATSVSGDVYLRGATSRFVRARTTSGDVQYEGTIDSQGRYEFRSHSGDVTLRVPERLDATLEVSTFSGEIESDFQLVIQPGAARSGRQMTFTIGQGAARVTAASFSGDITLQRRP